MLNGTCPLRSKPGNERGIQKMSEGQYPKGVGSGEHKKRAGGEAMDSQRGLGQKLVPGAKRQRGKSWGERREEGKKKDGQGKGAALQTLKKKK